MSPSIHSNGNTSFARAALDGLAQKQKHIPCTWLYDPHGSELFEQITELDEYYPTRIEIALLRCHAQEMVRAVGPEAIVLEIGSGSSRKTPLLLRQLEAVRAYIPIDIAAHCLQTSATWLKTEFSDLPIHPLVADFHLPLCLPAPLGAADCRHLCFFPGSTIGNFDPEDACKFLSQMANCLGANAWMLIGVDCTQDPAVLIPAYDDPGGVTANFNLNLLARLNRELGANFDLDTFAHQVRYDDKRQRIEMHLVSREMQAVRILGQDFLFNTGESIHTENSYKYSVSDFEALARSAGWQPVQYWRDQNAHFSIHFLERAQFKSTTPAC